MKKLFGSRLVSFLVGVALTLTTVLSWSRSGEEKDEVVMAGVGKGKTAKVIRRTKLNDYFEIVEAQKPGDSLHSSQEPVFVLIREGKPLFTIDMFGNGYELYVPEEGRTGLEVHKQTWPESEEQVSVVRYVVGRDGKRMEIHYNCFGEVIGRTPQP